jgi:hypothetical protein
MQRLRGVFALAADKLVVSGPGYQCTFQITGWGWVILLTGLALGAVRTCRLPDGLTPIGGPGL